MNRILRSVGAIARKFRAQLESAGFSKMEASQAWRNVYDIAELELNAE